MSSSPAFPARRANVILGRKRKSQDALADIVEIDRDLDRALSLFLVLTFILFLVCVLLLVLVVVVFGSVFRIVRVFLVAAGFLFVAFGASGEGKSLRRTMT